MYNTEKNATLIIIKSLVSSLDALTTTITTALDFPAYSNHSSLCGCRSKKTEPPATEMKRGVEVLFEQLPKARAVQIISASGTVYAEGQFQDGG
jgi:hypothetical protein